MKGNQKKVQLRLFHTQKTPSPLLAAPKAKYQNILNTTPYKHAYGYRLPSPHPSSPIPPCLDQDHLMISSHVCLFVVHASLSRRRSVSWRKPSTSWSLHYVPSSWMLGLNIRAIPDPPQTISNELTNFPYCNGG